MNIIGRLPFWILYRVADFLFFLLCYIFRYRRAVIRQNLSKVFPEKSTEQLRSIERGFYRNLADIIVETIRQPHLSAKQVRKMIRFREPSAFSLLEKNKRNIQILLGHTNNWEIMAPIISLDTSFSLKVIYQKVHNEMMNQWYINMRSAFDTVPIQRNVAIRYLMRDQKNHPVAYAFLADQKPKHNPVYYDFFGVPTPFYPTIPSLAIKLKMSIVFIWCTRVKRGQYVLESKILAEKAEMYTADEINKMYISELESVISKDPSGWLWSHRRWKTKWKKKKKKGS